MDVNAALARSIDPLPLQRINIAMLGAPAVGKTAIIEQFLNNHFSERYVPTETKRSYRPSMMINEHVYEVNIIDCPAACYFPDSSPYDWRDFARYGLRMVTAYVLVYDINDDDSFQYVRALRDQIIGSRPTQDFPIFVLANKHDLSEDRRAPSRRETANLVKKHWKCGYIECSAKYNWHVVMLFKELMKAVDSPDCGHKPASVRVQDAFLRNKCVIL